MKKIVENLESKTQGALFESVIDDAAELLGLDASELEGPIDRLSFSDYLELGNAVDIGDEKLAREILGVVSDLGEISAFDADDEDDDDGYDDDDLIDKFDDGDDEDYDDDDGEFDMGLSEADNAYGGRGDNAYSTTPAQGIHKQTDQDDEEQETGDKDSTADTLDQTSISQLKADATKQAKQKPARVSAQLSPSERGAAMQRLKNLKKGDEVFVRGLDGKPVKATYQGADRSRQDFMAAVKTEKDRGNTRTFSYDDLIDMNDLEGDEMKESFNYDDHDSVESVRNAIWQRIRVRHMDLIQKYGIDAVSQAVDSAAYFYGEGGLDEIGSSDVSAFVDSVRTDLGEPSMFEATELARMRKLAGIKETANGGSTGAGAIASAPAAVGGVQKRVNPSIYASKPEPKPRKKDKKGDGLGRSKKT